MTIQSKRKVAIVGGGVSGIAAAWALNHSKQCEVHIYEASDYLGGHTNTVPFQHGTGKNARETMVDTGFIVANTATYPNFLAFLDHLQVPTVTTDMTFGVSRDAGAFEWSGTSLSAIFAQRRNLLRPVFWRMIFDIIRFNTFAVDLLKKEGGADDHEETIGQYLAREGYSEAFAQDYLIPMTACVWSTSPEKCALEFPAITLVRFLWNHHLLNTITARPTWLTIPGGSKRYIDVVMADFPQYQVHLSTPVRKVGSRNNKPYLKIVEGTDEFEYHYDNIILATHGDQALELLSHNINFTPAEHDILSAFKTSTNTAILHSDRAFMPRRRKTWAAWNFTTVSTAASRNVDKVSLTYNMNILQHIPTDAFGDVLVTLNPLSQPKQETVQGEWVYHHPLYNPAAVKAQNKLPEIQGKRGIYFAGAWTGYGFHEDGFTSGLRAAASLGAKVPWEGGVVDAKFIRERPRVGLRRMLLRVVVALVAYWILILDNAFHAVLGHGGTEMKGGKKKIP